MLNYIYLLFDKNNSNRYLSLNTNQIGRKIGSTCNIKIRMKPYLTGHPDKVPLECYYQILNPEKYSCYEIDNMIKIDFDEHRIKSDGGIEFYDVNYITSIFIEEYFNQKGIEWKKFTDIIINDDFNADDFKYLKYDLKHHSYYNQKTYLDKYIDNKNDRKLLYERILKHDIGFLESSLIFDQIQILLNSIIYYDKEKCGIWNLFCRYGKTRLSCLFCKMQKYNKILILVPSLYLINQTYNTWITFFDNNNIKKICCEENDVSLNDIHKYYNENEICIFISTYHSSYKFNNLLFDICIFDEAHRTAGLKVDSLFKIHLENTLLKNKLFLTATTKEYIDGDEEYYSMDDKQIYGKIIACVSAKKAKELNRICNYNIITIELKPIEMYFDIDEFFIENNITDSKIKKKLMSIKDKYLMSAEGLFQTMKHRQIKHVISFHDYIINCIFFKAILQKICNYHIAFIDGTMNIDQRNKIIKDFQDIDYSILCSAKVLQEGVDIPKCDGVIFIDIKRSIIDTIQSLSRCLTYILGKIANIMIPFDDKTDLLNDEYTNNLRLVLRNLAENDENLKEFFEQVSNIDINSSTECSLQRLEELKIKYKIDVNSKIINELKEICYETYFSAKKLIVGKYTHSDDYRMNIKKDFTDINLPLEPNIIYKRFGWKGWDDYLGLESQMTTRKIKSIIHRENENRLKLNLEIIDTKDKYIDFASQNKELELPLDFEPENGNWIRFLLKNYDEFVEAHYKIDELKEVFNNYKISNEIQYRKKSLIDIKLIKYEYISNGFYYESKNGFNINNIYYIESKKKRRF